MKAKRGRPTTTTVVTPPGMKWCNKGEHFVNKAKFTGIDSYCQTCRKDYNTSYKLENDITRDWADLWFLEADYTCKCGTMIHIEFENKLSESGIWECWNCDRKLKGTVKGKLYYV